MDVPAKEPRSHNLQIEGIELFAGLSSEGSRVLRERALVRTYAPDALLWRAGELPTALHVVLDGEVRVVRETDGRQIVLHTERRGGTLGDVALFSNGPFPATAIAATRAITLVLTMDTLLATFAADPIVAVRLLERIASRVRQMIGRLDQQTSQSVVTRVARHVLGRGKQNPDLSFTLGMTQLRLAEEVGTAREVVVRTLASLVEMGAIERLAKGRYRVQDLGMLERVAWPRDVS